LHVAAQDAADRKERRSGMAVGGNPGYAAGAPPQELLPCTAHVPENVVPERRRDALCPGWSSRNATLRQKMAERTTAVHPQSTIRQLPKQYRQAVKSFQAARVGLKGK